MSNDNTFLPGAIRMLCRLDHEGQLDDYRVDVAEASRGPSDDLDRHPEWRYSVAKFARLASQLFGVSVTEAHQAAIDALLPSTRRRIALQILDEYEQRLDEAALKAQAERKIRRRVG